MEPFAQADVERSLVDRFAHTALRVPSRIAVRDQRRSYTFAELAGQVQAIAGAILSTCREPTSPIAVLLDHDASTVATILAVLASGHSYVPLDPSHPRSSLAHMLRDSGASTVIVDGSSQALLADIDPRPAVLDFQAAVSHAAGEPLSELAQRSTADSLACVLYTSGSTGAPKGIVHTHRSIAHLVWTNAKAYGITADDHLALTFSSSYAASLSEIFGATLSGASLSLVRSKSLGVGELAGWVRREGITVLKLPVGLFRAFLRWLTPEDRFPDVRLVHLGGEALYRKDVESFRAHFREDCVLYNRLASTESLSTTRFAITRSQVLSAPIVPVGYANDDTEIFILDEDGRPMPPGEIGQIAVRSRYLASGYWRNPGLTAASFKPGPPGDLRTTLHTGDLGRLRPDGCLQHFGRRDQQVKIRGFRIELTAVEAALSALDDVKEAAAATHATSFDTDSRRLFGYVVPAAGRQLSVAELRRALADSLPEFMIPSGFVVMESLPTTSTGKLDRRRLPIPTSDSLLRDGAPVGPRTAIERQLVEIWREVLQQPEVGIQDSFFDLGGDSLLLLRAHARICTTFGMEIPPMALLGHPTVEALAGYLAAYRAPASALGQGTIRPPEPAPGQEPDASIAIVGMACVFPGARDLAEFWRNLRAGVESVRTLTDEEIAAAGADAAWIADPATVKTVPEPPDFKRFDALFFGMSPRDATLLDPQHRLLLETAWHALEHAGHAPAKYAGRIGIFAGCGQSAYAQQYMVGRDSVASPLEMRLSTDPEFASTRVAYKLNLRGPAVNVTTACSTALVAVHLACRSLLDGECEMALAGGASVESPEPIGYRHQVGWIVSPDGHCRAFAADAQGTVLGSGAGMVVLKRLDRALTEGDTISAVIRGTAVNNDGGAKVGFAAPSIEGQSQVVAAAQAKAGVTGDTIDFVEGHGTGTPLGDPIEMTALSQVFRSSTDRTGYCALGSVKSNIGHLRGAAGVAGLIKTVLALTHREIPPTLHCARPNPDIDWPRSPFYVNAALRDWPASPTHPRRAAVSAFGVGGTNAHVIVEEAPTDSPTSPGQPWQLLPLSARDGAVLAAASTALSHHLAEEPAPELADVAYTLQTGRHDFAERRFVVCRDRADARLQLDASNEPLADEESARHKGAALPVVFMFPGQGAQHVGMGRGLYETVASFRADVDHCAEVLAEELGVDLRKVLFSDGAASSRVGPHLAETRLTQPALLTIEWALARLLMRLDVQPAALIGHSIGEHTAACIAGVWDIESTLRLVARRGRLIQSLPPGRMLVVHLPETAAAALCDEEISLAAVNAPSLCVLAGPETALRRLTARLEREVIDHHLLRTSHAFHSWMMDPALPDFTHAMTRHPGRTPEIPCASGVTGNWMRSEDVTAPDYFSRLLRGTVRFSAGLRTIASLGPAILLEVGPGRGLGALARKHPELENHVVLASLRQPREARHDRELLLRALGGLWLHGVRIDWQALHAGERRRRVPLPGYPFQRREHWAVRTSTDPQDFGVDTHPTAAAPPPSPTERDRIADAPAEDRRAHIARYLGRTINALLGHPPSRPVEKDRPLADLGVDSLLSIQLQARITAELRVELAIRDLLARTIGGLADRISKDFASRPVEGR